MAAKIYNALQLNRREPEIEKVFRKNQNGFSKKLILDIKIFTIRGILEGVRAKNLKITLLSVDFSKAPIWLHTQREDGANTSGQQSSQRNRRSHNDAI